MGCNRFDATLTIYHLAAYAGLTSLLKSKLVRGIDVDCSNAHGITPLYLAKLNVMRDAHSDGESDPWRKIDVVIEKHGGVLTYHNRKAELHLLYKHLFGSFLNPFRLDTLNSKSEWFYENDVNQCTASDFDYKTGTLINRHKEERDRELRKMMKSLVEKVTNNRMVPREFHDLEASLKIYNKVKIANLEFLQLDEGVYSEFQRIKMEVKLCQVSVNLPSSNCQPLPTDSDENSQNGV